MASEKLFDAARVAGVDKKLKEFIENVDTAQLTVTSLYDNEMVTQHLNRKLRITDVNEYLEVFTKKFRIAKTNPFTHDGTKPYTRTDVPTVLAWLLNSERVRYVIANVYDSHCEANSRAPLPTKKGTTYDEKCLTLFRACFALLSFAYRILLRSTCTKLKSGGTKDEALNEQGEWDELFSNGFLMSAVTEHLDRDATSIIIFEGCICCLASHLAGIGLKGLIPYIMDPQAELLDDLADMKFTDINSFAVHREIIASEDDWDVLGHWLGQNGRLRPLVHVENESSIPAPPTFTVPLVNDSTWKTALYKKIDKGSNEQETLYELQTIECINRSAHDLKV
jgi:hypothetical protein